MKGLSECKASESNVKRIQVKDIVKEVEDYLKTYSSAGMDIILHGELITIFGAVVKLTLGELSALWLSCSWICDALAVRQGDSSSSVPMLLGLVKALSLAEALLT
ncbi:hypothetical protein Tco_0505183 [Tanacetum coccineum]